MVEVFEFFAAMAVVSVALAVVFGMLIKIVGGPAEDGRDQG